MWSIFKSRARRATVSEMHLVMMPVLIPAMRASMMAVPSWAWKPLASIRLTLWNPTAPESPGEADLSGVLCAGLGPEPTGAGNIQILPSVSTPSTSKIMSLILRARAAAEGFGIVAILAFRLSGRCPSSQLGGRRLRTIDLHRTGKCERFGTDGAVFSE